MAEIRIEKRRSRPMWPWVIGLIVLAVLFWGIAELVDTSRDNERMVAADTAGSVTPGAPAGTPRAEAATPAAEGSAEAGPAPLIELMPLGVQDVGQGVTASGIVRSRQTGTGFWLEVPGGLLIWVRGTHKVQAGETMQALTGTLRQVPAGALSQWLSGTDVQEQLAKHTGWRLETTLYLDASPGAAGGAPRKVR